MSCIFNKYFELASNNNTGESLAIKSGCDDFLSDQDHFFVAEITFKVPVITSSVAKITFVETEITF